MAFVLLVGVACGTTRVHAATIYVRIVGDDANDGSSPARALRGITRAAAIAKLGDRIVVGPGTYHEGDVSPAAPGRVSFIADRLGKEVGDPAGDVVVDATGSRAAFLLSHNAAITIDGFVIYGAASGIYIKSHSDQAVVSNNIISNNRDHGVYIQDSKNVSVFNNLVYNNGRHGILVTGNLDGSPGAQVINNTVYGNSNRGIFFAGTSVTSPNGLVINNIAEGNRVAGFQIDNGSLPGYVSGGNLTADRHAHGTPIDVTDITGSALFIDPAGPDKILGGAGYADDNFRLSHAATGQGTTSPAVDAGTDLARQLKLARSSTRTDSLPDRGWADAGFHYGNFGSPPPHPRARLRYQQLYVDASTGADTNDGKTVARAMQTIAHAIQIAQPGNRVVLRGGTFHEGQLQLTTSGKPGRDILIEATNGSVIDATGFERAILISGRGGKVVPANITLDGLDVTGAPTGVEIRAGVSNVTIRRCHLHGNSRRGLYVNDASAITVVGSIIDSNGSRGIQAEGAQVDLIRTSVMRNPDSGLWAINSSTVTTSDSDFLDNTADGVLVEQSALTMTGGTISGSTGGARFKNGAGTLTGVTIVNNSDVGVQGASSAVNIVGGRVEGSTHWGVNAFVDSITLGSSELAVTGTRICNNQGVGLNAQDTAVTLTDMTLCANANDGLRQKGGAAYTLRTTVTGNQGKGLTFNSANPVVVRDARVGANADNGVQIVGSSAMSVSGSVVYSNIGDGLTILDCPASQISNNLVYANGGSGIQLVGDASGSPNAQVLNNTIFGNAQRGLVIGGSNAKPPSSGAMVLRNIIQGNGGVGLQVNDLSLPGYVGDYNLNADSYFIRTPIGLHDIIADPLLVRPAGADGILGGAGAADDDFHLSQRLAGQSVASPAVDAGGIDVTAAGIQGTTRTDGVSDTGVVDLGYHYGP